MAITNNETKANGIKCFIPSL